MRGSPGRGRMREWRLGRESISDTMGIMLSTDHRRAIGGVSSLRDNEAWRYRLTKRVVEMSQMRHLMRQCRVMGLGERVSCYLQG